MTNVTTGANLCALETTKQVKHDANELWTTITDAQAITQHTIRCKRKVSWTRKREDNEIHARLPAKGTRQPVAPDRQRALLTWEWKEKGRESEILIWTFASPQVTATNDSGNDFVLGNLGEGCEKRKGQLKVARTQERGGDADRRGNSSSCPDEYQETFGEERSQDPRTQAKLAPPGRIIGG